MIKIFDAKNNIKKELNKKEEITIYVCGPTVYNSPHIGNLRPLLTFDVLYRLLNAQNYNVYYVHNITDIDDKIINKAQELNLSEYDITNKYTKEYFVLMDKLNVLFPEIHKVSDEITDIINFIQKLIDKNYAYINNGDVYFDVRKVKEYGEVSHNNLVNLYSSVRIENEENKNYPLDFVLWKKTDNGLNWKAPWSTGRPGWHTECVVMINKYLNKKITIHGGGVDLKFPHHENENAQNYGVNNLTLADIFQYVGHLTINGQKMSKSLGNVTLAKDILEKYDSNIIRWFFYQKYYASPIDYSENIMNDMTIQFNKIENIINIFKTRYFLEKNRLPKNEIKYDNNFLSILNDDLNLANAISKIVEYSKNLTKKITNTNILELEEQYQYLLGGMYILGINLKEYHTNDVLDLIKNWNDYLKSQNFTEADKIRSILQDKKVL